MIVTITIAMVNNQSLVYIEGSCVVLFWRSRRAALLRDRTDLGHETGDGDGDGDGHDGDVDDEWDDGVMVLCCDLMP